MFFSNTWRKKKTMALRAWFWVEGAIFFSTAR